MESARRMRVSASRADNCHFPGSRHEQAGLCSLLSYAGGDTLPPARSVAAPEEPPKSNQIPIRMFRRGFLPSKVKVLFLADGVQIDLPCNTQSDHAIACQHGGKQLVPDGFPV